MSKNIKTYVNSILNQTEECLLTAELTDAFEKSKGKIYFNLISNKSTPQEKA
jgi:hypothetical protein